MLELRRLRLLHELRERGTIAAVGDALQFTPSAVSQQLAVLEREAGVALLEAAGRGVRLTDAGLVLAGHAGALLDRAARAEAELAAAAGGVGGRGRIASFQSVALKLAVPAIRKLAREAPGLRCELVESEPEQSLPALALGDVDLVLADEWHHQPLPRPPGVEREDLWLEPVQLVLPRRHPPAQRHPEAVPLTELAREVWACGHPGTAWEELLVRSCREFGHFEPDIRHRTNDSVTTLALVAAGQAVTLLPELVCPRARAGVTVRAVAGASLERTIFAASRTADSHRPSVRALLAAIRAEAADLGWLAPGG